MSCLGKVQERFITKPMPGVLTVKICVSVYELYLSQEAPGQSIPGLVELNQSSDFFLAGSKALVSC